MTQKITAIGALLAVAIASGASAQAQQPAQAPVFAGPVIPGLCVYSTERLLATSTVGRHVQTRMQQLGQAVQAEITGEQTTLQNDARTLEGQRATLPREQLEQRVLTLNQRGQSLERKSAQRARELELTQLKAFERVATEAQPLIQQAYVERGCGILLDRNSVFAANAQMDITDSVIQKLNAKIQTFNFDRERLDQQQQQTAARPAPPAKK